MAPVIEVVLCSYNGERYIAEQLRSIVAQTRRVDLISVHDDGSTDATLAVAQACVDEAAAAGVQLRLSRNPRNLGYAQNFAHGIRQARGELLLLCDQDDVWAPNKVERLSDALDVSGCAMAFSDGVLIDADGDRIGTATVLQHHGVDSLHAGRFRTEALALLLRGNCINGAAMAVRREAAVGALPVPAAYPHDYWLALWAAAAGGGIAVVDEPLYRYRQHAGNLIGAATARPHHQLASIWRDPGVTRRLDLARTEALSARLPQGTPQHALVEQKQAWLVRVSTGPDRWTRLGRIASAWWRGDYARFGAPHALLRDVTAACRRLT